jgi:hypothetical protein
MRGGPIRTGGPKFSALLETAMQVGPIKLEKDTLEVLLIAGGATGLILALTALGMLANNWNSQAVPDRAQVEYVGHGGDHH